MKKTGDALTESHFSAIGCPTDLPVVGIAPGSRFRRQMIADCPHVDKDEQRREVLRMAGELLDANPDVGAIVSECTNLAPHSSAIADTYGVPVFDVVTMIQWFHSGLRPRNF